MADTVAERRAENAVEAYGWLGALDAPDAEWRPVVAHMFDHEDSGRPVGEGVAIVDRVVDAALAVQHAFMDLHRGSSGVGRVEYADALACLVMAMESAGEALMMYPSAWEEEPMPLALRAAVDADDGPDGGWADTVQELAHQVCRVRAGMECSSVMSDCYYGDAYGVAYTLHAALAFWVDAAREGGWPSAPTTGAGE